MNSQKRLNYMQIVPSDNSQRFCAACGAELPAPSPPERLYPTCLRCGRTAYRNPAVGVAVLLRDADHVLLGRRARGPYAGRWCVPCGYVDWDEDVRDAARREMREETGLEVEIGAVAAVHSNFHDRPRQTVGVWFAGRAVGGSMRPGDDIDALAYFAVQRVPALAFPSDATVLTELAVSLRLP